MAPTPGSSRAIAAARYSRANSRSIGYSVYLKVAADAVAGPRFSGSSQRIHEHDGVVAEREVIDIVTIISIHRLRIA
jgi:hypothetical protein